MSTPRRRLRRRLMMAFGIFAVLVASLFTTYAVIFVYIVEDRFFNAQLEDEASHQHRHRAVNDRWMQPRNPDLRLIAEPAGFPDGLDERIRAEPWRREFPGLDGRHYHLLPLTVEGESTATAWLLAEVSGQLVVRPMRPKLVAVLAGTGLAVLVFALLVGGWIARRGTAPLTELADLVAGMHPDQLPQRLPVRMADDEVGVLAQGLEDLLGRVRAFIEREKAFTRDVSHELRTPLAVIRSAADRLAANRNLEPSARQHLDHIRQSASQLAQTVSTLLDLAREPSRDQAKGHACLLPIIEQVIVDQATLIENKSVRVEVDVARDAHLPLPPGVVQILLSNLVGNAFAHTQDGEVRIDHIDGELIITNCDQSPSEPLSEALFEPFQKRQGSAGFGLGLGIVRRLCERHGLTLRVESAGAVTVVGLRMAAPRI